MPVPLLLRTACEKRFRPLIYRDFEEYVMRDYESGSLYGLEKFWAFHYYHKGGGAEGKPKIREEIQVLLDKKFRTLEDFQKEQRLREACEAAAGDVFFGPKMKRVCALTSPAKK